MWIAWSTDDHRVIACDADLPTVMRATAADCGCLDIGWTRLDDGWTLVNNLWGYIIRKCLVVEDVPPQRKPRPYHRVYTKK